MKKNFTTYLFLAAAGVGGYFLWKYRKALGGKKATAEDVRNLEAQLPTYNLALEPVPSDRNSDPYNPAARANPFMGPY